MQVWWGSARVVPGPRVQAGSGSPAQGGGHVGCRVEAGAGVVVLKSKPTYAGCGTGTAQGPSFLHSTEINLCSLQASKLEKQSSMSESDYDNPTTPLELEETG